MRIIKIVLFILMIVAVFIQFFKPARNQNGEVLKTDITKIYKVPKNIQSTLETSCYDCHSNNTHYPWYTDIQPAGWWMASHIKKGREELNFSDFGSYSNRRQQSKLQSIINSINDQSMPLSSYTFIHENANLSKKDQISLQTWAKAVKDSLSLNN